MGRLVALVALALTLSALPRSARADFYDNPYPCMLCLFEIRAAGGQGWILPNEHMNTFLDVSPDREQVLFWEYHDVGGQHPYIARETIYGKRTRVIADVDFEFVARQRARWSRGGRRIAFPLAGGSTVRCGGSAIWVVNVDGRAAHRVAGPCATTPTWSPDSRRLAFFDDAATPRGRRTAADSSSRPTEAASPSSIERESACAGSIVPGTGPRGRRTVGRSST